MEGVALTLFQFVLLVTAGIIFYLFFRQLFSGNYPKRGVDYEASVPEERIGGINRPDKTFSKGQEAPERVSQLLQMADEAIGKGDNLEAKKALQSALMHREKDTDIMRRLAVVYMNMNDFNDAKEIYEEILSIDPNDDLAHASLANALHRLGEDERALQEHEKSISLDPEYAAHYYNYANTLYDLGEKGRALELYREALRLDPQLEEAKKMIEELER